MTDLNMMMREQARSGLKAQLDAAVTNGDLEAANKIAADMEKLAVSTAPKAPAFGNDEIKAELDKQPWFGIDPRKSAKVVELGKTMDPKKFATAAAFAEALVKAVDEEFKTRTPAKGETDGEDEGEEDEEDDEGETDGEGGKTEPKTKAKPRRTDAPGEGDASSRSSSARRTSGPWLKLSDAPGDIQKEVRRAAERFVPAGAAKEQREKFITKALESHYAAHSRGKGKK